MSWEARPGSRSGSTRAGSRRRARHVRAPCVIAAKLARRGRKRSSAASVISSKARDGRRNQCCTSVWAPESGGRGKKTGGHTCALCNPLWPVQVPIRTLWVQSGDLRGGRGEEKSEWTSWSFYWPHRGRKSWCSAGAFRGTPKARPNRCTGVRKSPPRSIHPWVTRRFAGGAQLTITTRRRTNPSMLLAGGTPHSVFFPTSDKDLADRVVEDRKWFQPLTTTQYVLKGHLGRGFNQGGRRFPRARRVNGTWAKHAKKQGRANACGPRRKVTTPQTSRLTRPTAGRRQTADRAVFLAIMVSADQGLIRAAFPPQKHTRHRGRSALGPLELLTPAAGFSGPECFAGADRISRYRESKR